jgi:oxygen-independent coproporphyrinogen-3 oxidase
MILQLKTGAIDLEYFYGKFGLNVWNEFESVYERLDQDKLVERQNGTIKLTRSGLLQVDHLLSEFFEPELKTVRYV